MFDHRLGDQLGNQDDEPQSCNRLAFENQCKFSGMFLSGRLGPQGLAKAQQLAMIAFMTGSTVLKKPFSLQELDDFMGAFRRPANSRFG